MRSLTIRRRVNALLCALTFQVSFLGFAQLLSVSAAETVPEHLISLTRSLLGQIEERDFPSGELSARVNDFLVRSRIKSWKGETPHTVDFSVEVAGQFGLDYSRSDHRELVSELLSATDESEQRLVIFEIYKSGGKPAGAQNGDASTEDSISQALSDYQDLISDNLRALKRNVTIDVGEDGESLRLEWDPETASFSAQMKLGPKQDEVVLHGGVSARQDGDNLRYEVVRDPTPITVIDDNKREQIYQSVFGVWVDDKGAQWTISGPGNATDDDAENKVVTERRNELDALKAQLGQLQDEKAFIWVNSETGEEVTQNKFKRLKDPFVYERERSQDFNKDKIEALKSKVAELEQADQKLPVDQYDPINSAGFTSGQQKGPILIVVNEDNGYVYKYDTAEYDGERITARRTLVDQRDVEEGSLPARIITEAIASWSPPEWLELGARYDPRTDSLSLSGQRWRLHVTYDPNGGGVDSIHTPYPESQRLTRESTTGDDDIPVEDETNDPQVRFVQLIEGRYTEIDELPYDEEIFVELVFEDEDPPSEPRLVQVDIGELEIELTAHPVGTRLFRTDNAFNILQDKEYGLDIIP